MRQKVLSFNKNGVEIEVQVDLDKADRLSMYLVSPKAETWVLGVGEHSTAGWYYQVGVEFAKKTFGVKIPASKKVVFLSHESAKFANEKAQVILNEHIQNEFATLTDDTKITLHFGTDITFVTCENRAAGQHEFFKESAERIHEHLKTDDIEKVLNRKADDVDLGDYAHVFTYEMTLAEYKKLVELAEEKAAKKAAEKREKEEKAAQREKELFDKAKETGEKQVLEQFPVDCDDPHEECDIDIVTIYAMPDGTKKSVRSHTW